MQPSVSHLRAIAFALTGFTLWVITDACIKLVAEAGLPPCEVIGSLGLVGAIFMLSKNRLNGKPIGKLWPRNKKAQTGLALLALGCNLCNVVALKHLPLTIFYIVVFTAPMVIAVLASCFLKERLTIPKVAAILAGFAGVVIAINPGGTISGDLTGYIGVTGSLLFFSLNIVGSRSMTQSEDVESLTFFNALVQIIGCLVPVFFYFVPVDLKTFLILTVAGLINVIANLAILTALKHAAAAIVSQFHYTQLIAGAILGYFIWHEMPTLYLLIGSAVIVGSGIYITAHTRKLGKVPQAPV